MSSSSDLVILTRQGLYCPAADLYIDPWRAVERAVITHAHADHARPGSAAYLCAEDGARVLRCRVGADATIEALRYEQPLDLGRVRLSLHPAGHILGSAQVRLEPKDGGPTWVISGDYKAAADPTCRGFVPVRCDVFLTESTFGLPIYRWSDEASVLAELNAWWTDNAGHGRTSIVLAYALGKAQRVLAGLDPSIGPIGLHGSAMPLTQCYVDAGVTFPAYAHASRDNAAELAGQGIIIAPPSALGSTWHRKFAGPSGVRTAMVSGWMRVRGRCRWRAVDRGFILSDHCDWPALLECVRGAGAARVGVTHGYAEQFARYLAESEGLETFTIPTCYTGEDEAAAEESSLETTSDRSEPGVGSEIKSTDEC